MRKSVLPVRAAHGAGAMLYPFVQRATATPRGRVLGVQSYVPDFWCGALVIPRLRDQEVVPMSKTGRKRRARRKKKANHGKRPNS